MLIPLLIIPILALHTGAVPNSSSLTPGLEREECTVHEHDGNGDRWLRLLNKSEETVLDPEYAPVDMVELPSKYMASSRGGALRAEAATALVAMMEAGSEQGHEIRVLSAFRSYDRQGRIFKNKARRYGVSRAARVSARAGHSQHQLGTTIDVVVPRYRNRLTQRITKSPEWSWLQENAHRFGFALSYPEGQEGLTGYMYEPWHYRYLGAAAATEMHELDMPMESYLQACRRCEPGLACEMD